MKVAKPAKPARDKAAKRIDGISATVTGLARALVAEEQTMSFTGLESVIA